MGPYKPLRNWVDEFIPYYMEISWELIDPIAHLGICDEWEIIQVFGDDFWENFAKSL